MDMGGDGGAGSATGADDREERAAIDAVHEVLSSRRRRYVLYHLFEEGELPLGALSRRVVEHEYDRDLEDLPVDVRQQTYLDLYHTHVPKLTDHGVVEYCEDEGTVRLTRTSDTLEACLEASLETDLDAPEQ